MRLCPTPVAVLLALGGLAAQDAPPSSAKAESDALIAEVKAAAAANRAASQAVQKTEAYAAAAKARDAKAMRELMAGVPPVDYAGFTQRFQAAAEKYASTDDAVYFLTWIAHNARDAEAGRAAVEALVAKHVESPKLIDFVEKAHFAARHYKDQGEAIAAMQRLIDGAKDAQIRGWAMYWTASLLKRGRDVSAENKAKAEDLLAQAAKLGEGSDLGDMIQAPTFEAERLQIGMQAPDIVGHDLDGVPFKLSDYRGKVVVLDFWGDW